MTRNRIARVRDEIVKKRLDALLISSLVNIRYLTGFTGSNAILIVSRGDATFLSDARYIHQAKIEVRQCGRIVITTIGLLEEAAERKLLSHLRVGFESQQMTYAQYRTLRKHFPSTSFISTSNIVEDVRLVKDGHEVELIRKATAISDTTFDEVVTMLRPGVRELEIAAEIAYRQRRLGAERDAFEIIVASGERSALPHVRASEKKIKSGELVTLDFGCAVNGYHSDITRTVAVGKVNREAKRMYSVVLDAQLAAIAAAKGGMSAKDLDAVARTVIAKHGLRKYFNHSLGHGLGLNVHEAPKVSPLSKERLKAGSVITIEPGVYVPDIGGVRIEDDVLLTEQGCTVLNRATKELIVV